MDKKITLTGIIKVGFILVLLTTLIYVIIWGFMIVPKQIEFSDKCEERCLEESKEYLTKFRSLPHLGLNGKCYCVIKEEQFFLEADLGGKQ